MDGQRTAEHCADLSEPGVMRLDEADPLRHFRSRFRMPVGPDGRPVIYLCGNSLGLQPADVAALVQEELDAWAGLAVDGHFHAKRPWYPYHEQLRAPGARLVGARPHEVVWMNGLTVNLHLLLASLFRPAGRRCAILIEENAFPSDLYVAQTQLEMHGLDPAEWLRLARPRPGEHVLRTEDLEAQLHALRDELALVLLPGVNYYTGQLLDMPRLTQAAHEAGARVCLDLAHAVGNVELELHAWDVDVAAWCSYKYLNSGPGAVAGCYLHERFASDVGLRRYGGWWGNDPGSRFRMHLEPRFIPVGSADGWQLSNPPILAMAPLVASLAIFEEAGMPALRRKSLALTGCLEGLLDDLAARLPQPSLQVITPRDPQQRGCQLSILIRRDGPRVFQELERCGVVTDFRQPDVIRVAPAPLYNTYHEVWRFVRVLEDVLRRT